MPKKPDKLEELLAHDLKQLRSDLKEMKKELKDCKFNKEFVKFGLKMAFHPTGFYRIYKKDVEEEFNCKNKRPQGSSSGYYLLDGVCNSFDYLLETGIKHSTFAMIGSMDVVKYWVYGMIFRDLILPQILK